MSPQFATAPTFTRSISCRHGSKYIVLSLNGRFYPLNCRSSEKSRPMLDPHANMPIDHVGHDLKGASCAVILLHGRGSSAEDILGLAGAFYDERISFLAPQAANNS